MAFEPIDLAVTSSSDGRVWLSAASRFGAVHGVAGTLAPKAWKELLKSARVFRQCVRTAQPDPDFQKTVGEQLRGLFFGEKAILTLFQRTRGAASARGVPLLVRILATPGAAASLPWELIHDPEPGSHTFLTLAPDAHLTRLARVRTYPVTTDRVAPPLRMLLLISSPSIGPGSDGQEFDVYEEKRALLAELRPLIGDGRLEVDVEDRPTVENLRHRVARRPRGYQVVHYIGHATTQGLLLETELGHVARTSAEQFNEILRGCLDLRLVFFAGCETAQVPERDASGSNGWLMSIADVCVRDAAPMVVGMQALLPFRTERVFSKFFYEALASGRSVADAVTLGRGGVYRDSVVGKGLLDWAVPSLIVAGEAPVAIMDADKQPTRVAPRGRREELKLDVREEDTDFFARHVALRQTVDFLVGRTRFRALWMTGRAEIDKVAFIDRALQDVDDALKVALLMPAERLIGSGQDPVLGMCELVAELLSKRDGKPRQIGNLKPLDWWERLVVEVVSEPFAIVISNIDRLPDAKLKMIAPILTRLVDRRKALLVITSDGGYTDLLGDAGRYVLPITLEPLIWNDVRQWIMRHRPALLRSIEPVLLETRGFPQLGERLDLWDRLADLAASAESTRARFDLDESVAQLAAELKRTTQSKSPAPATDAGGETTAKALRRPLKAKGPPKKDKRRWRKVEQTSLRVAVAGFHVKDRESFAAGITQLASQHGVGGRVIGTADPAQTPIAELLPLESPFNKGGTALTSDILLWINQAKELGADVILADFGSEVSSTVLGTVLTEIEALNVLAITAGSNDDRPVYPAWSPKVFAVGPLGADGRPAGKALWDARAGKPDIFAPDSVRGTPLEQAVKDPSERGSSFAALNAVGAAILVWATDRTLNATGVRDVLLSTATEIDLGVAAATKRKRNAKDERPVKRTDPRPPRALSLSAALARTRERLVIDALSRGPLEIRELIAATGLRALTTAQLAESLAVRGRIRRTIGRNGEFYESVKESS